MSGPHKQPATSQEKQPQEQPAHERRVAAQHSPPQSQEQQLHADRTLHLTEEQQLPKQLAPVPGAAATQVALP